MEKKKFGEGIFLSTRKSKSGKDYLKLSIKKENGYEHFICFKSDKVDKYGNNPYTIYIMDTPNESVKEDLPF